MILKIKEHVPITQHIFILVFKKMTSDKIHWLKIILKRFSRKLSLKQKAAWALNIMLSIIATILIVRIIKRLLAHNYCYPIVYISVAEEFRIWGRCVSSVAYPHRQFEKENWLLSAGPNLWAFRHYSRCSTEHCWATEDLCAK